ncbi:hypothetical protein StrepF001_14750 [Streptomyces sp. F001]|uniref:hypothetical protein n=1 Tax=Streptomyces sp. F001 TaxID=1510026 RepID=UPI00101E69D8|nr:hypothetical protein [Streptomyces sp. F001]RZB18344.1 hypothetical protein StrepF001_14750 [Streptomyces sp. F001]
MAGPELRSLSDEEILDYFRVHDDHFREALHKAKTLLNSNKDRDDYEEVMVPIASLRLMCQTMLALYKTVTEMDPIFSERERGATGDRGDRILHGGDWNPLTMHGVDFGDPWN